MMKLIPGKLYRTNDDYNVFAPLNKNKPFPAAPWKVMCQLNKDTLVLFVKDFEISRSDPLIPSSTNTYIVYRVVTDTGLIADLVTSKLNDASNYFTPLAVDADDNDVNSPSH